MEDIREAARTLPMVGHTIGRLHRSATTYEAVSMCRCNLASTPAQVREAC